MYYKNITIFFNTKQKKKIYIYMLRNLNRITYYVNSAL